MFSLNPAYLNEQNSGAIEASFVNYLLDARYGYTGYTHHVPAIGTLGFGIRYAGYGDLDEIDESGNVLGGLNAGDLAPLLPR